MESDADRRATIAGLGGETVATASGSLLGIVEREPETFDQTGGGIESASPTLTACRADVLAAGIDKGTRLTIGDEVWVAKTLHHHRPAFGWTTVTLRK